MMAPSPSPPPGCGFLNLPRPRPSSAELCPVSLNRLNTGSLRNSSGKVLWWRDPKGARGRESTKRGRLFPVADINDMAGGLTEDGGNKGCTLVCFRAQEQHCGVMYTCHTPVATCHDAKKRRSKSYHKTHIDQAFRLFGAARRAPPSPLLLLLLLLPLCGPVAVSMENSRMNSSSAPGSMLLLRHRCHQHLVALRFLEVLSRTDPRSASSLTLPWLFSFKKTSLLKPLEG